MIGVEATSYPYIFFGEDDAYLSPGHIKTLFDFLATGGADAAAAYWLTTTVVEPVPLTTSSLSCGSSASDFVNLWEFYAPDRPRNTKAHSGSLAPYSGPYSQGPAPQGRFDTRYRGNAFREETDFYLRAYHHGAKLYLIDAPPAFHYKGQHNSAGGQHGRSGISRFSYTNIGLPETITTFSERNADAVRSFAAHVKPFCRNLILYVAKGLGISRSVPF